MLAVKVVVKKLLTKTLLPPPMSHTPLAHVKNWVSIASGGAVVFEHLGVCEPAGVAQQTQPVADDAKHLVALREEQFGEVGSVLPRNPGDDGPFGHSVP